MKGGAHAPRCSAAHRQEVDKLASMKGGAPAAIGIFVGLTFHWFEPR